jgi:hypothetical protein
MPAPDMIFFDTDYAELTYDPELNIHIIRYKRLPDYEEFKLMWENVWFMSLKTRCQRNLLDVRLRGPLDPMMMNEQYKGVMLDLMPKVAATYGLDWYVAYIMPDNVFVHMDVDDITDTFVTRGMSPAQFEYFAKEKEAINWLLTRKYTSDREYA